MRQTETAGRGGGWIPYNTETDSWKRGAGFRMRQRQMEEGAGFRMRQRQRQLEEGGWIPYETETAGRGGAGFRMRQRHLEEAGLDSV